MCLSGYDHPAGGPGPVGLGPCQPRMWSAGPVEMEGGTLSDWRGDVQNILHLRHGVRSFRHLVPQRTYTHLKQEYAALVTCPSECHVTAQDSYLPSF
jgi:hypothetical protein